MTIAAFTSPSLVPVFPEIFLAVMGLFLLLFGVAGPKEDFRAVNRFAILTLVCVALATFRPGGTALPAFGGLLIIDHFGDYMKILVLLGSAVALAMSTRYLEREHIARFEYPILVMFSALGMMLMISASNLMSMYVGLELQSLPLYVLAAIQRDTTRSTEAGLKYFVLGALASGLLLYGMSLLYGYTGVMGFEELARALGGDGAPSPGIVFGMVLLLSGLAFKISAVPFHMWTPDVYEGAPASVTAFFAIVPKIAALALIVRVFVGPFGHMVAEWQQVVSLIAAASMLLGAFAAIVQKNIKRLLAYSSIGHMGYALVGLAAANVDGIAAIMMYAAIYMTAGIGAFCVVLMMKQKNRMVESISDLAGLGRTHPMLGLAMTIMMFSMAGIPPLAGFFGKLFVFQAAVKGRLFALSILGVLASVVAAYYYIRVIKVMYFDEAGDDRIDAPEDRVLNVVLAVASVVTVVFTLFPGPLLSLTSSAALALLQ